MGDHRIDLDLAVHVPVDDFWYVGPAARAAERRTLPNPAGNELERSGRDFLSGFCHTDNDGHAPAAVARLQRLAHDGSITRAVERKIGAAIGQCDQMLNDIAIDLGWIDEMRHAKTAAPFLLAVVDVNAHDLVGAY